MKMWQCWLCLSRGAEDKMMAVCIKGTFVRFNLWRVATTCISRYYLCHLCLQLVSHFFHNQKKCPNYPH